MATPIILVNKNPAPPPFAVRRGKLPSTHQPRHLASFCRHERFRRAMRREKLGF